MDSNKVIVDLKNLIQYFHFEEFLIIIVFYVKAYRFQILAVLKETKRFSFIFTMFNLPFSLFKISKSRSILSKDISCGWVTCS